MADLYSKALKKDKGFAMKQFRREFKQGKKGAPSTEELKEVIRKGSDSLSTDELNAMYDKVFAPRDKKRMEEHEKSMKKSKSTVKKDMKASMPKVKYE